jgi:UDP-N-acetylmuramoylalanine--D-glutamate ligase
MRNADYFKNKKVAVIGLARSGLACANLLYDLGADVAVSDNQDNQATRANIPKLKSGKIKVELGRHTPGFIKRRDLVVISPGVPAQALPIRWAKDSGIRAISEIELAWILCPANIIAVTGSNGKSTVTTLIGRV